jgi:glycolate dehydrogenase iron-sulfur subunit
MSRPKSDPPAEFQALYDHVATCSRCGFCQPACPIFRATGREGHVARGKMALYRNVIEERTEIGPDMRDAFSNCLQCRACTESCFSALETDKVVRSFHHAYADRFGRSFWQRRVFRDLLPRPRVMRALVRSIWALRRIGLADAANKIGLVGLLNPKLERALDLRAGTPGPLLHDRLAKRPSQPSGKRPLVGYWMSCGYNYVLPEVGEATVRVLERMGMDVEVLNNCCCGLAAHGYGDREAAERLARENLRRLGNLERFDAIVSECGSCSGHLKDYPELLAGDPHWAEAASRLEEKVRSFSEFVIERGDLELLLHGEPSPRDAAELVPRDLGAEPTVVTYHEPCHLGRRYQNVVDQPRQILESLPGFEFREAAESDSCCGAAGTYGVLHPETSAAIIERKLGFIGATGASVVATECPSCMIQLAFGAERTGLEAEVLNVSQLCDRAAEAHGGQPAGPESSEPPQPRGRSGSPT